MDFSEMLFYGGIIGMAGTAVISIIVVLLMRSGRKRLQKRLDSEYGDMNR